MRKTLLAAAALSFALGLPAALPAFGQTSLTAFDAAKQALLQIWDELPLSVRNVTLTEGTALGYGNYTPHTGSFAAGEVIHVYLEVLGYGWQDNGDGTVSELLEADLSLINAEGSSVASQAKFLSADIKSREKLLETYLTLDATLTDFTPGDYTLRYTLHDRAGGEETSFDVPIVLVGDASSSEAPADTSSSAEGAAAAQ